MENIKGFLQVGYGNGDGSGDGSGHGNGYGNGYGYGYGYSDGSGDGYGNGYGLGSGYGDGYSDGSGYGDGEGYGYGLGYGSGNNEDIEKFNGRCVYQIDGTPTLIDSIHGQYAKGSILNSDLTLKPCFIAKCGDYFAHGDTLRQARKDARAKYEKNLPTEERIRLFMEAYPSPESQASHKDLFRWHHTLTGSCEMGRREWCRNHGLDHTQGTMTVRQFLELTKDAYGGDIIKQVYERYEDTDYKRIYRL